MDLYLVGCPRVVAQWWVDGYRLDARVVETDDGCMVHVRSEAWGPRTLRHCLRSHLPRVLRRASSCRVHTGGYMGTLGEYLLGTECDDDGEAEQKCDGREIPWRRALHRSRRV